MEWHCTRVILHRIWVKRTHNKHSKFTTQTDHGKHSTIDVFYNKTNKIISLISYIKTIVQFKHCKSIERTIILTKWPHVQFAGHKVFIHHCTIVDFITINSITPYCTLIIQRPSLMSSQFIQTRHKTCIQRHCSAQNKPRQINYIRLKCPASSLQNQRQFTIIFSPTLLYDFMFGPRRMFRLVIEVYEGPFDLRKSLKFHLQRLTDVVSLAVCHVFRQDNVNLNEKVWAKVKGTHRVDVVNLGVVVQRNPRQLLEKVGPRCVASQHFDLICATRKFN